jgi:RNA polymerase sigma factor (sigma-70 family)
MVSSGTSKEASRPGERFIPTVLPPRKSFLDSLSRADLKLLDKHLQEPAEYVYSPKFKLARTEREFFGKSGAACPGKRPKTDLTTPDSNKMGSGSPSHSAESERFLFDRYNYTRYRIYNILQAHAGRVLPIKASREFLLWARRAHQLRSEIIQINMPLVLSMTKRSRLAGLDYNDMISEGNLALIRSVEKFDTARGFKFSTYSCRAILKSFSRLAMRTGRYRGMFPVELTTELEKSDYIERKRVAAKEDFVDDLKHILTANLAHLNDVENTVIRERFALDTTEDVPNLKTLEQVGRIIGVTKERVRQIQNKALKKIKVALEDDVAAA